MKAEEPKHIHRENPGATKSRMVFLDHAGWLDVAPARQGTMEVAFGFVCSQTPPLF